LLPILLLAGCTNIPNEPKPKTKPKELLITPIYEIWPDKITETYAKSSGFYFTFKVYNPYNKTNFTACLDSFVGREWSVIGKRCINEELAKDTYKIFSLPVGGRIKLVLGLESKQKYEDVRVNICYNATQIFILTGCVPKNIGEGHNQASICKYKIIESLRGPIKVYSAVMSSNRTHYILSFRLKYFPDNRTYISSDSTILSSKCYLSYVIKSGGIVEIPINISYITNTLYFKYTKVNVSSVGEDIGVTIIFDKNKAGLTPRDIISIKLKLSYIIFKQMNFGKIVIEHS